MPVRRQRGSIIKPGGQRRKGWAIKYADQAGKQHWEGGFKTRGAAQARLNEVLPRVDDGSYIPRQEAKFKDFALQWLEGRLRVRGSTSSAYGSIIRAQLIPRLGELRVSEVTNERIQAALADMTKTLKPKTVHNAATLLRTMFAAKRGACALRLGYVGSDPTTGLELPEQAESHIVPPTREQAWALISAGAAIGERERAVAFIGAHTGVRRNELLALRFSDVAGKELRVQRALSKTKGSDGAHKWQWVEGPPKSKKSKRRIGLTDSTLEAILTLKRGREDHELLFPGRAGLMDPDMFDAEVWKPIATAAKIPTTRFHDLRHFFASQLISQGENPKYVCDQLGHASIQITLDTYGHLFPTARAEASERLEKEMAEAKPKLRRVK